MAGDNLLECAGPVQVVGTATDQHDVGLRHRLPRGLVLTERGEEVGCAAAVRAAVVEVDREAGGLLDVRRVVGHEGLAHAAVGAVLPRRTQSDVGQPPLVGCSG